MPYQDSNPKRRNLIILSSSIIFFYAADGKLKENTLKLPLINLEFHNTEILVFFIWVALLYLGWRFWQEMPLITFAQYRSEMVRKPFNIPLRWYTQKHTGLTYREVDGFVVTNWDPVKFTISYQTVKELTASNDASVNNDKRTIPIKGFSGRMLKFLIISYSIIRQPYFADQIVPFILFFTACLFGLFDLTN